MSERVQVLQPDILLVALIEVSHIMPLRAATEILKSCTQQPSARGGRRARSLRKESNEPNKFQIAGLWPYTQCVHIIFERWQGHKGTCGEILMQ